MADGIEVGTAYLSILPDTKNLGRELKQAMSRLDQINAPIGIDSRQIARDLGEAGTRGGRDASQNFDRALGGSGRAAAQDISRQLGNAGQEGGKEAARAIDRHLDQAGQNAGRGLSRNLSEAGQQGGRAGGQAGGEAMAGGIADKLKSLGGKAGPIGAALGAAATAGGLGAAALFVSALKDGMAREATLDLTQARLGVDDETMKKFGTAASQSFKNAFGESFESNLDVARLAAQGGLFDTDADVGEIQAVIDKLTTVNDVIEGDVMTTTKAASVLMKNGLAGNASDAFDIIAGGYVKIGNLGDDLFDSISEYASGWKNTGLSAEESLALIDQSLDLGADNTDRAADSLREFGRRVTEEGDTIVTTLNGIGLNGEEMYEAFKRGGPDAFNAFDQAFDRIREIPDRAARNAAAMALLGDTSGDFIDSLSQWDPSQAVANFGAVGWAPDSSPASMR